MLATTRHGRDVKWLAVRKYPDFPILTLFHHPRLGLLIYLTYAVPVELDHIRDPAKVRGHEVFQVRSELPDAPLYR
ncbi:MAG: hypothetical protein ACK5DR_16580 [Planctomyces sp.]